MEIGHNVMHGQWDWMRDSKIHSTTWEWDNASPSEMWKHSHNEVHHTYTNVRGKDHDLGYGIMRVDENQKWVPFYLAQPLWNFINACVFQYGIAAYDLADRQVPQGPHRQGRVPAQGQAGARQDPQARHARLRAAPAAVGPVGAAPRLTANLTANLVRNLWTHSVIMCGHFPEGVQTFEKTSIDGETRGEWYLRQMLGSANISGSPLLHFMSGNLSFQIEHHLFPDLPSNRYQEIAPKVQELFERYGLTYTTGSLPQAGRARPGRRSSSCRCRTTSRPRNLLRRRRPVHRTPRVRQAGRLSRLRVAACGVSAGQRVHAESQQERL